jgi:uncharacterized protein (DUF2267 family)
MAGAKLRGHKPQAGEALQRVLEARGTRVSTEEAARLSATLLSLIQQGLIVPAKPRVQGPDTPGE